MNPAYVELALAIVAAVLAITLHEAAHGYAALAMGDDTAKQAGRLSLNPLRHVDPFGTILLPGGLLLFQLVTMGRVAFMFGWAKPVPVAAWKFRNPRRGMMVVAAAGPAMNFLLAWLGALSLHLMPLLPPAATNLLGLGVQYFVLSNLVLGLFNLLPVPPMDGGRIVVGLLPERAALRYARIERYGLLLVILLLFVGPQLGRELGFAFDPIGLLLDHLLPRAIALVLRLAGFHGF